MFTFKALHDLAHRYLSNLLDEERSDYNLRLPNQILFGINDKDRQKLKKKLGNSAFAVAGPKL